jgi:hypothetical protein
MQKRLSVKETYIPALPPVTRNTLPERSGTGKGSELDELVICSGNAEIETSRRNLEEKGQPRAAVDLIYGSTTI